MFRENPLLPFPSAPPEMGGWRERREEGGRRKGAGEVREIEDLLHTPHLLPANLLKNWGGRKETTGAETVFSRRHTGKMGKQES